MDNRLATYIYKRGGDFTLGLPIGGPPNAHPGVIGLSSEISTCGIPGDSLDRSFVATQNSGTLEGLLSAIRTTGGRSFPDDHSVVNAG